MHKLILFDVDKTLIGSVPAHKSAFEHAFHLVYGVDAKLDSINVHGMTDRQIIIDVLALHGLHKHRIMEKLDECADAIVAYYMQTKEDSIPDLLPGVKHLLDELKTRGYLLGLVTGNLEPIAWAKLELAGIKQYFSVGGFGSDDLIRAHLVRHAIHHAKEKLGFVHGSNVLVIGDTPKDIIAAKEARVPCLAVATGVFSEEELRREGAHAVIPDFTDTEAVVELIEKLMA